MANNIISSYDKAALKVNTTEYPRFKNLFSMRRDRIRSLINYARKGVGAILCTGIASASFAQLSIHVKSAEGAQSLPFATILNTTKHQLYFADENGILSANFQLGDSLLISYVGYKSLKAQISQPAHTFILVPSEGTLPTVTIGSCKLSQKHTYSNLLADSFRRKFGGVCCWKKGATNARIAVMLKWDMDAARLRSFTIWLKRAMGAPKLSVLAPMAFSFYSIDEATMLPGDLISNQQVIHFPKKEGKQTLRIDSLHLPISPPGIYISMEFIYHEKYAWASRFIDTARGIDAAIIEFGSRIDGIFAKDFTLAFYDYEKDQWSFAGGADQSTLTKVHGTIRFSAEIYACKNKNQ
jgi:hypothetical protein